MHMIRINISRMLIESRTAALAISAISLSSKERILTNTSFLPAQLWNLKTNQRIGTPLPMCMKTPCLRGRAPQKMPMNQPGVGCSEGREIMPTQMSEARQGAVSPLEARTNPLLGLVSAIDVNISHASAYQPMFQLTSPPSLRLDSTAMSKPQPGRYIIRNRHGFLA
ncbi:hypothetical protein EDB19DRAFT_156475 [Suillus lakei]|nr:hypothetical protein EDB19DRAFT_156475 [Suillus lakei]